MRATTICIAAGFSIGLLFPATASPQEMSSQEAQGTKVCVALVNDASPKSLDEERMTQRLARSLGDKTVTAVVLDSRTTSDRNLHPTTQNSEEMKSKQCDYLLVTQVSEPRSHPADFGSPQISIGGRVPSVDASDPLGGQSGPQRRDNLEINFALFRPGNPKAVLDTRILDRPSANVSDSLMQAMDREASRIQHEIKKKK